MPKWEKGQSGNPLGRRRAIDAGVTTRQLMAKARIYSKEALQVLVTTIAPRHAERVQAANLILEPRSWQAGSGGGR